MSNSPFPIIQMEIPAPIREHLPKGSCIAGTFTNDVIGFMVVDGVDYYLIFSTDSVAATLYCISFANNTPVLLSNDTVIHDEGLPPEVALTFRQVVQRLT